MGLYIDSFILILWVIFNHSFLIYASIYRLIHSKSMGLYISSFILNMWVIDSLIFNIHNPFIDDPSVCRMGFLLGTLQSRLPVWHMPREELSVAGRLVPLGITGDQLRPA